MKNLLILPATLLTAGLLLTGCSGNSNSASGNHDSDSGSSPKAALVVDDSSSATTLVASYFNALETGNSAAVAKLVDPDAGDGSVKDLQNLTGGKKVTSYKIAGSVYLIHSEYTAVRVNYQVAGSSKTLSTKVDVEDSQDQATWMLETLNFNDDAG